MATVMAKTGVWGPMAQPRASWLRRLIGDDVATLRVALSLAILAFALRALFWAVTGRVWEDALITVLHSENAGRGLGLTHVHVDEPRIHGFTSPISVLVPLAADIFHPGAGLVLIRLLSMVAASMSVLLVFGLNRVTPSLRLPLPLVSAAAGYIAIEHHQMLWGMAGMETQLVTCILLFALYAVVGRLPAAVVGLALAATLYARPDYLPLASILCAVELIRAFREKGYARMVAVAVVAILAYAPWLLFTTLYYGSPVPNTVLAKSAGYRLWIHGPQPWTSVVRNIVDRLFNHVLGPQGLVFGGNGIGYESLLGTELVAFLPNVLSFLMVVRGAAVAVARRQWDMAPYYVILFAYLAYYVFLVPIIFGWYTVPINALTTLLAMKGLTDFLGLARGHAADRDRRLWAAAILYLGVFAATLTVTIPAERNIQRLVENRVRKQIGLDLRAKGNPKLTVAAEPLGYIAYYSGLTEYDYPGLSSRRVVAYLKAHPGADLGDMMKAFRPDYLALRQGEVARIHRKPDHGDWLDRGYVLEKRYVVPPADRARLLHPANNADTDFRLYRKIG